MSGSLAEKGLHMAVETIEGIAQKQAKQEGQFDQFSKRFEDAQMMLVQAINGLREDNKFLLSRVDAVDSKIGEVNRWRWATTIAAVIAACALYRVFFP